MSIVDKLSSGLSKRKEGLNIEVARLCVENPSYLNGIFNVKRFEA